MRQRLLRRPDARLHAHDVADAVAHRLVDPHQVVDGPLTPRHQIAQQGLQQRTGRLRPQKRGQLRLQQRLVGEWNVLGVRLEKEVERVDRRHVRQQVDRHVEMRHPLGKDDTGEEIALRVLLPVHEVAGGWISSE